MPRDSGGTYTLVSGNPVISGTVIASTWANTTMDDIAAEMTDSLSRTGSGGMQAPLKFTDGSESNPSQTFTNDPLTGRYLAAVSDMRDTVNATDMARYTATSVELNYAGTKKFETTTDGVLVAGDIISDSESAGTARVTTKNTEGGISLYTNNGGGRLYQTDATGASEDIWIDMLINGSVSLYYDGIKKFETTSNGVEVDGRIEQIRTGTANVIHDLRNDTGGARFLIDSSATLSIAQLSSVSGLEDTWISCTRNAGVALKYDNNTKFQTISSGARTSGTHEVVGSLLDVFTTSSSPTTIKARNAEGGGAVVTDNANLRLQQTDSSGNLEDNWLLAYKDAGVELYYNGSAKLITTNTGITVTGVVFETSDSKLKENLEIIPNALDKVCAMNGYTFDMKGEDTPRRTGVIAQEVQAVLPEAVGETDDGTLTVAYGNLVGVLIESIKELKAEIELLKAN